MFGTVRGVDAICACRRRIGSDLGSARQSIDGSTTDGGSRQALVPSATGARSTGIQHEDHAACDGDVSRWSDGPYPRQRVARSQKPRDWPGEACTGDRSQTRSAPANKRPYRLLSTRRRRNVCRAVYWGNQPTRDRPSSGGVCRSRWGSVVARVCRCAPTRCGAYSRFCSCQRICQCDWRGGSHTGRPSSCQLV